MPTTVGNMYANVPHTVGNMYVDFCEKGSQGRPVLEYGMIGMIGITKEYATFMDVFAMLATAPATIYRHPLRGAAAEANQSALKLNISKLGFVVLIFDIFVLTFAY